jgi:hypothetical protein
VPPDRAPADIAPELRAVEVDACNRRVSLLLYHLFAGRNVVVVRKEDGFNVAQPLMMFYEEVFVARCLGRKPSNKEPSVLKQDGVLPAAKHAPEQAPAMHYADDRLISRTSVERGLQAVDW